MTSGGCRERDPLALKVGEEKQFVFNDGTAECPAVAVTVKTGIGSESLEHKRVVHRVQVAIPEVFVQRTVERVGPAPDGGVELTAGGVTKLGVVLVRQEREVLHGIVGNRNQVASHGFVVVVDTFDGEVVVVGPLASH